MSGSTNLFPQYCCLVEAAPVLGELDPGVVDGPVHLRDRLPDEAQGRGIAARREFLGRSEAPQNGRTVEKRMLEELREKRIDGAKRH